MLTSSNERRKGEARKNLMDWENETRLNMKVKANEDHEEPIVFDAPNFQNLDEDTENQAKGTPPPPSDFDREMMRMESRLVTLTL